MGLLAKVGSLLGGDAMVNISRTPDVMGEAAKCILMSDPNECNGRNFIDDEVLASLDIDVEELRFLIEELESVKQATVRLRSDGMIEILVFEGPDLSKQLREVISCNFALFRSKSEDLGPKNDEKTV